VTGVTEGLIGYGLWPPSWIIPCNKFDNLLNLHTTCQHVEHAAGPFEDLGFVKTRLKTQTLMPSSMMSAANQTSGLCLPVTKSVAGVIVFLQRQNEEGVRDCDIALIVWVCQQSAFNHYWLPCHVHEWYNI